jgi:Trk K+ transport system NAD-binding subunit
MMPAMTKRKYRPKILSWRSGGALFFFGCALVGFELGVGVSERPDIAEAGTLVRAYYSLSLFVVGGVDLGTPYGGPLLGRVLVWLAYFGAPILAASALMEAMMRVLAPQSWQLRRLKNHIIVVGDEELSLSYLRVLRRHNSRVAVVVVSSTDDQIRRDELEQDFNAIVVTGDVTHEYFLKRLRVHRASKILLLDDHALRSYEAASQLISMVPGIGSRVIIHCGSLRFMRAMENTRVAQSCETFNTYHLGASGLVRNHMVQHFRDTSAKDVVVIAGFGRFGQTVLEELQLTAAKELDTVIIIDSDAHRRVLVADEQMKFSGLYERKLYEGDIANPEVWERVARDTPVTGERDAVFVLGTGREDENLRTALWIRRHLPNAMIVARTNKQSRFACEVGAEHNILSISINQLVEENIPTSWITTDS